MRDDIKGFVASFLTEIEAGNAAIFAGAGLSAPAGFVDWANLVRPLAEELHLDVDKESDLVAVAQFHVNANHHRISRDQADVATFYKHRSSLACQSSRWPRARSASFMSASRGR